MGVIAFGLLKAKVHHKRYFPKENSFNYGVYYVCAPYSALKAFSCSIFSHNRFNLFSHYSKDYGKRDGSNPSTWVDEALLACGAPAAGGEKVLLTMPRVLGYAFNPVSFWFCFDENKALKAVLAEVNNTFGETHSYVVAHDDAREILATDTFNTQKQFHVSPFMEREGSYEFRFDYKPQSIGVWIDYYVNGEKKLATSVLGTRQSLDTISLLRAFFSLPMVTLKVVVMIHFQAIKIWLKGMKYIRKPEQQKERISK